ncbi:MAG: hypothetical protein ACI88A_004859 [Paraglaciecola sp.]|jgi:hypothetical protein
MTIKEKREVFAVIKINEGNERIPQLSYFLLFFFNMPIN